jgi:hypothetical protein
LTRLLERRRKNILDSRHPSLIKKEMLMGRKGLGLLVPEPRQV